MSPADIEKLFGPLGDPALTAELDVANPLDALREVNPDAAERFALFAKLGIGAGATTKAFPSPRRPLRPRHACFSSPTRLYGDRIGEPLVAPVVDGSVEVDWDGASGEELVLMVPPEGAPIQFVMNLPDGSGGFTEWDGFLPADATLADVL